VLAIEGEQFTLYETTAISSLKVKTKPLRALREVLGIPQVDAQGAHLKTQLDKFIAPINWHRVDKQPDAPSLAIGERANDPFLAFDIVWHTFDENYAFFELRGTDWKAAREKYRGQLTNSSTRAELFEVLASMLAALDDNHVELNAEGFVYEQHRSLPDYPLVRKWRKEYEAASQQDDLLDFVRRKYSKYIETSARLIADRMAAATGRGANDKLAWGMLPDEVGYLCIRDMDGFVSDEGADVKQHLRALDAALDRAMDDLADARAMIVDVRFNGGGWDRAAVRIANRFADHRRAAFTKKARTANGFTPPYTVYVEPAGSRQFTRPVVVLTSSRTASAAEIFVFCMNVLPHVQQAGIPTTGIHSDQLVRHLPTGWRFQLSNEVYQTIDGKIYEKIGIPPDVPIAMFNLDDFADGKDSVVEKAWDILRRRR
jgi:hypothetical protein